MDEPAPSAVVYVCMQRMKTQAPDSDDEEDDGGADAAVADALDYFTAF